MANITNVNELWGRKWRFKDNTPSPSEFSLRNSVVGVKFATFYLGEEVKDVYQTDSSVSNVGITTQGTFIRIGVSESSFTYAYAASGWVGKPAILEFIENTNNYTLSCTNESNFITWFNENATEYVPPLSEWTKGIADAIREKKGTSNLILPLNFEKEIKSIETGSGGFEINGLIEEYKVIVGEKINAGDFVEFVNSVNKILDGTQNSCYTGAFAILLEENKVFITYGNSSSYYLYGTIVEIDGLTMTVTTTQLSSTSNSCRSTPACVLLEPNKVFIAHSYSSNSYLYGTIVEINGLEMTPTTTQLSSTSNSCYNVSPACVLLEPNKVFIAHSYSSNSYLYGTIVEINGLEMTATSKDTNKKNYVGTSCVLLEPNKVFIAYTEASNKILSGAILTINGTTMTLAKNQSLSTFVYNQPKVLLLEPNKVFIASNHTSTYSLLGTIVEINGTTMTPTTTQLTTANYSSYSRIDCILLEPNKIFLTRKDSSDISGVLSGAIIEINGTEMTINSFIINGNKNAVYENNSCILLEPNKIFITYGDGNTNYRHLYGTLYIGEHAKQTTDKINGVAKTSGTEGQTIQVYVPNN